MAAPSQDLYDLLVVTDATASMGTFLTSLNSSLQDIIRISATTACFSRIGVLGYRDYDRGLHNVTEWSGWHSRHDELADTSQDGLLSFIKNLRPDAGGDWPEAARTGLAHAHTLMRPEAKTIVLLYADAPPHTEIQGGLWKTEQAELKKPGAYGGVGSAFADWVSVANTLALGDKRAQVFSIIAPGGRMGHTGSMFTYLSTRTGGICISLDKIVTAAAISKLTVGLLMAWMGADKAGAQLDTQDIGAQVIFADASGIEQLSSEKDTLAGTYLPVSYATNAMSDLKANLSTTPLSLDALSHVTPRRETPVPNFSARYKTDASYRAIVCAQLAEIIEADVAAIALNPVFGTLWRTVCNDRINPARDALLARFGLKVERLEDAEKKARMKTWLEESYDWAGEINETVKAVPEGERFPCVFLDPTVRFQPEPKGADEEEGDGNNPMEFTRDEVLEIGRSCDYRILRRLGRILTRLTYVSSEEDLPAHVKDVPEAELPRIPMALAKPDHQRKFWKVLLHVVVPGTMLAARPAALLAALSVRMGIQPLAEVAYSELLAWRDNWNTLDIPETWNASCLGLLLEADRKHRRATADAAEAVEPILKPADRELFQALVNYKLLEMNMDTSLDATLGWTPDKNKASLGPVAVCKTCEFPRSVTIMAPDGVCGLCATPCRCESKEAHQLMLDGGVSKTDSPATSLVTWTECFQADCRAQYVVYHPGKLNVRPKCHYCRQKSTTSTSNPAYNTLTTAPCVSCTNCRNRIIYPAAYRPQGFSPATFLCPACSPPSTITPVVTTTTTPRTLSLENGTAFLLTHDATLLPTPFSNRSLFHTANSIGADALSSFAQQVIPLPAVSPTLTLTLRGKPLHNVPAVLSTLRGYVTSHRVETPPCSLCFTPFRRSALRLACGGRKGCAQHICSACFDAWYGTNRPGGVINVGALACPFCRRQPTGRVSLPGGLRFVSGLADAVKERGEWVYAWCAGCDSAKRFVERVCAGGAAEVPAGWRCESCEEKAGKAAMEKIKMCPACGVATEKMAGCDHISCVCGKHWCFNCAEKVADGAGEIYEHMTKVHGTWYVGAPEEDGGYYGDEWESEVEE
ncbi:hypothetical protein C8A05DRAFT_31038 [Staphylotrichum tortipilum]|uniref:RING-type domain-containing protein n=1 Tax=Staphylotrichum tortipilum TaxID=2831512 RepID=A0AAN6RWB6_9PEZI|nr:hypothetical protein C8A05DRAFT_31038 [Staphylotrichum longicolle]